MSNPKDWFRRRRREPLSVIPPETADPFENGPVLELSRASDVVVDHDEPALNIGRVPSGPRLVETGAGTIPPPPPRESGQARPMRVIEPSAFAVRPEVVRLAEAARKGDERSETVEEPRPVLAAEGGKIVAGATPSFAVRRRAVPLQRVAPASPASAGRAEPASPKLAAVTPRPQPAPEPSRTSAADDGGEMPSFTLAAPGNSWVRGKTSLNDVGAMNAVLREAFTPTRPKQQGSLFSGRYRQMQRIICAIEEERAHVVLYGERGSGKTSLANIVAAQAVEAGYFVKRQACSSELSFDDIFREFLRGIPATFLADGVGATIRSGMENFEQLLPEGEIGIPDLIHTFEKLHDKHVILIVDEYDRVTNETTKNKLAELIKNMSDASAPVTLVLIGVSENVDELLGKHPSLQRTLVTIPLPLMSRREIEGIITAGEEKAGLAFAPEVRARIVEFAQGLPYHAQLLCLFAARNAVRRGSKDVDAQDLRYAVQRAAEEAEGKLKERYNLAIGLNHQAGASFKDVLWAAARCNSDEFGTFTVGDVALAAAKEDGSDASTLSLQYPLKKLTDAERGGVLRRIVTPDGLRYQFFNQMMRHYVLVRQAQERGVV